MPGIEAIWLKKSVCFSAIATRGYHPTGRRCRREVYPVGSFSFSFSYCWLANCQLQICVHLPDGKFFPPDVTAALQTRIITSSSSSDGNHNNVQDI